MPTDPRARARAHRTSHAALAWKLAAPVVGALAGLLAVTSMINAKGTDLRGGRNTSLVGVVDAQRNRVADLLQRAGSLQTEVERLTEQVNGIQISRVRGQVAELSAPVGLTAREGPGLVVELDDAPLDQPPPEAVEPDLLLVHQQDIQAVVNALWAGGADAISLQGQRVISTTGIKCVGNTVLLQGVPYSPPYRIEAIGDPQLLKDAIDGSTEVQNYLDFVAPPYNLGWSLQSAARIDVPAYTGSLDLSYARKSTK